ncbi:1,4-alpha-glucan branching protein domain-containing protein [Pseudalkalibacillus decolorationis]|uniref:1,4-alpha-glucan branching protein domain-containing protein n=1 Tax=Pseudalkalibacillus decolorationis TaxID=163879 RepID=UPI0021471E21|nr:1,4-alpha-glucan branching protein domain-containing protein [Pseudalkalibacillus decolorationis]
MKGYFAFVLHAHLPYVLHKESGALEERWLFEAITESYIPLIWGLEERASNHTQYTLSLSPPLLEMLADERLIDRYLQYIDNTFDLIEKESSYVSSHEESEVVSFYKKRYQRIKQTFLEWNGNLIAAFRFYVEKNKLECLTSSATHAFLPYLLTEQGIRLQIQFGIQCFEHHFGFKPDGFWLPECAFTPGIDKVLYEEGVRYTFVDEGTIRGLDPTPKNCHVPTFSPHGIVLFPRHNEVSRKVWDAQTGYPGDPNYREFYRDIGYTREFEYIKDHIHPEGIRVDTGLKYHKITGETEEKESYVRKVALDRVVEHSNDFVHSITGSLNENRDNDDGAPPLTLASFDAELFGHWWYEGPEWISALLERGKNQLSWITPKEYIKRHYQLIETHHASFSSWGRNGFGEVWLNDNNAWIYRHLHEMERQLIKLCAVDQQQAHLTKQAIKLLANEWMLAASSDWAFIMDQQSSSEYAIRRIKDHLGVFNTLKTAIENNSITPHLLQKIGSRYPFLECCEMPNITSEHDQYIASQQVPPTNDGDETTILMLSWEFPPNVVGGLARHVYDLSRAMAKEGHSVYVITSAVDGSPDFEVIEGVHVYRVRGKQPYHEDFYHWSGSLNLAISELALKLAEKVKFDCIHAHDWIVSVSAKGLQQRFNLPLIATIHATEHGRNNGIHTDLQGVIHHKEWELMYEAKHIIVCSTFMKHELKAIFQVPEEKIAVIPNGVDPLLCRTATTTGSWKHKFGNEQDFYIFSLGRIVPEKGYAVMIDTASLLKDLHPSIKFIIAGRGPMLDTYRSSVKERNLENNVFFIGYVSDEERNMYMSNCDAVLFPSLYEPFGIVALEGMAARTPVIASDTGGLDDIIDHNQNGLKVYAGNPESMRDQILVLYENGNLSKHLVENAWSEVTSRYSWDHIAVKTANVVKQFTRKPILTGGE